MEYQEAYNINNNLEPLKERQGLTAPLNLPELATAVFEQTHQPVPQDKNPNPFTGIFPFYNKTERLPVSMGK